MWDMTSFRYNDTFRKLPSLAFDSYNKLTIENVSDEVTGITLFHQATDSEVETSVDIGTDTDVFIDKTGSYRAGIKATSLYTFTESVNVNIIIDTIAPVITFSDGWIVGDADVVFKVGDPYNITITVTDEVGETIIPEITGTVHMDTIGSYEVTYSATDAAGNIESILRTYVVEDSFVIVNSISKNSGIWNTVLNYYSTSGDYLIYEFDFEGGYDGGKSLKFHLPNGIWSDNGGDHPHFCIDNGTTVHTGTNNGQYPEWNNIFTFTNPYYGYYN
jgi:hypothetical protein